MRKQYQVLRLAIALCFINKVSCAVAQEPRTLGRENVEKLVPLNSFLLEAAIKLDCYFTVERDVLVPHSEPAPLTLQGVEAMVNTQSKAEMAQFLRRALPNFDVAINSSDSVVIHLIEKSLSNRLPYALEEKGSLRYLDAKGLSSVAAALSKQKHALSIPRWGSFPVSGGDWFTRVSFTVHNRLVRDILTNYIPLSRYNRILWTSTNVDVSEMVELKRQRETWVKYIGRKREYYFSQYARTLSTQPTEPFSTGEIAYALNPNTPAQQDAAIAFIEEQMKRPAPFQVRWAMLFLGKHKVERAAPLLLKYLSYQYAPLPLIEEAHPAVRALILMGEAALPVVQEKLLLEADPAALVRLMKIVLGEKNAPQNQEKARAIIAKSKDEAQRARLEQALRAVLAAPSAWINE